MSEMVHGVTEDNGPAPSSSESVSVGARLRAAREAARLSHDDVAQALKFSPRQIAALEADDYAALPGATIVRGFVRNYARLLKLDATALLQQLDTILPSGPAEVRPPDNMGMAGSTRGLRESSPWVSLFLIFLLAAVLLVLWHFFGPAPQQRGAARSAAFESLTSVTPESGKATKPPEDAKSLSTAQASQRLSGEENNSLAPADAAASGISAEAAFAPVLHFAFADRSWVEVIDANGRILHSGENPAGSQLDLSGQPPFDIVIGNAGKVTLTYGGRTIDLAPHTRAEVARLRLE